MLNPFDAVADYVRQRLVEDPDVRATVLFGEAQRMGYRASYPTFVRRIRNRGLRPQCQACLSGRAHTDIEHPPGEEIQWDWLELRETPWGERAFVLVGVLSYSGAANCVTTLPRYGAGSSGSGHRDRRCSVTDWRRRGTAEYLRKQMALRDRELPVHCRRRGTAEYLRERKALRDRELPVHCRRRGTAEYLRERKALRDLRAEMYEPPHGPCLQCGAIERLYLFDDDSDRLICSDCNAFRAEDVRQEVNKFKTEKARWRARERWDRKWEAHDAARREALS